MEELDADEDESARLTTGTSEVDEEDTEDEMATNRPTEGVTVGVVAGGGTTMDTMEKTKGVAEELDEVSEEDDALDGIT